MKPPYEITSEILKYIASISEKIGEISARYLIKSDPILRKQNQIKTIHSSLSIEGNTLTEEQITAILENKRVIGPQKDIVEVLNALEIYKNIRKLKASNEKDFLKAHKCLLKNLIQNPGEYRKQGVGIVKGTKVEHIAPPFENVPFLMKDLFEYLKDKSELTLIKSCVFHYELEFIHPFIDGNGRMGRLWQTVILRQQYPVFDYLPIETLIKNQQADYYNILAKCDKQGESTLFIEFMLAIIDQALEELLSTQQVHLKSEDRITLFKSIIGDNQFNRKDYMRHFKDISTATASRDLKEATENSILERIGDGRMTKYKYIKLM